MYLDASVRQQTRMPINLSLLRRGAAGGEVLTLAGHKLTSPSLSLLKARNRQCWVGFESRKPSQTPSLRH